jgi:hypothetical protein
VSLGSTKSSSRAPAQLSAGALFLVSNFPTPIPTDGVKIPYRKAKMWVLNVAQQLLKQRVDDSNASLNHAISNQQSAIRLYP